MQTEQWKDHDTRELITRLTECAERFGHTEQMRERVATIIRPIADRLKRAEQAATSAAAPAEPSRGLLISMALRLDHGLGVPGYYDQPLFVSGFGLTHAQRLEQAVADMRKVHEEVSGSGFYSPEREAEYLALGEARKKGGEQ